MKNYKEFVKHIRDETEFIIHQSTGLTLGKLVENPTLLRAMVRSIEVIGEACKNIPEDVKARYPNIEWKKITGTRDVLIHHYFNIDNEILWDIIINKIPPLHTEVLKILADT